MNAELIQKITQYVECYIGDFHSARIAKLQNLDLHS